MYNKIEKHLDLSDRYAQQNPSKYEAHMHRAFEIMQGSSYSPREQDMKQDMSFGSFFQNKFSSAVERPTQEKKEQIVGDIKRKFYSPRITTPIELHAKDNFWSFANSMSLQIEEDPNHQVPWVNGKYWSEMRRVVTKEENGEEVVHARIKRASMLNLIFDFGSPKYNTFWPFDWLRNVQHVWTPDAEQVFGENQTPQQQTLETQEQQQTLEVPEKSEVPETAEEQTSEQSSESSETEGAPQETPPDKQPETKQPTESATPASFGDISTNERFKSKCSHRLWQRKCDRSKADLVIDSVWFFKETGKTTHVYWRDHSDGTLYRILTLKDPRGLRANLSTITRTESWLLSWDIFDTVEGTEELRKIGTVSRYKTAGKQTVWEDGMRTTNHFIRSVYLNKQDYYLDITQEFIDSGYANQTFLCAVLSALDNIHT